MVKLSLINGKFLYMKDDDYVKQNTDGNPFAMTSDNRFTIVMREAIATIEIFEPNPIYAQSIIYNKITTKDIE